MAKKQPSKKQASGEDRRAMVVTCSGDRSVHEVAHDLNTAGFVVGQILESIGTVTGHAHRKLKKKLEGIRGVADVSEDQPVDIGPPGAPIS